MLVKAENLQQGGSFKIRGALNKLLTIDDAARRRGVVAFSSGNFAQGLALAAAKLDVHATLVMPDDGRSVGSLGVIQSFTDGHSGTAGWSVGRSVGRSGR